MMKFINLFVFILFLSCGKIYKHKMNQGDDDSDDEVIKEINVTPNGQNTSKNIVKKNNYVSFIQRNIELNSYFANFILRWGIDEINLNVPYDILILIGYFYNINLDFIKNAAIQDFNNHSYYYYNKNYNFCDRCLYSINNIFDNKKLNKDKDKDKDKDEYEDEYLRPLSIYNYINNKEEEEKQNEDDWDLPLNININCTNPIFKCNNADNNLDNNLDNNKKAMIAFLHNKYDKLYNCLSCFHNITTWLKENNVLHNNPYCKLITSDNLKICKIPQTKINKIKKNLPGKINKYKSVCTSLNDEKINDLYIEISKDLNILLYYGDNDYKDCFKNYDFFILPEAIINYYNKNDYQIAKIEISQILGTYNNNILILCTLLELAFNNKDFIFIIETMLLNNNETIKNIFLFDNNEFNGLLFIRKILYFAINHRCLDLLCKIMESCGSKIFFTANSSGYILYDFIKCFNTIDYRTQKSICNHKLKPDKFYKGSILHSACRIKCMPCVLKNLENSSLFNEHSRFGNTPYDLLKFFNKSEKNVIFNKYLLDNIKPYCFQNCTKFLKDKLNHKYDNYEDIEDIRLIDALLTLVLEKKDSELAKKVISRYRNIGYEYNNELLKVINPKIRFFIKELNLIKGQGLGLEKDSKFLNKRHQLLELLLSSADKYCNDILIKARDQASSDYKKIIENNIMNKR